MDKMVLNIWVAEKQESHLSWEIELYQFSERAI